MQKLLQQALHLNTLRKLLGWSTLEEAIGNRLHLEIVPEPRSGKVLVLAPQPGDDMLGVGGTLAAHQDQGDEIRIIYLCDGRLGSKRQTTEIIQEELKKTRRREAVNSAEILGIPEDNLTFWGYRDGNLTANKTIVKALTQILSEYVPKTIYVPHPTNSHPDHEATMHILVQTLRAIGDMQAEIWSYEVWQPTFANRLIEIGSVGHQKELAIRAHESQLKYRPYDEAMLGLNTYRGGMMGLAGPAEGFLALKPGLYLKLWDLLRGLVD